MLACHKSQRSIGGVKLSSDTRVIRVGWRANRLVDMLAKAAVDNLHGMCGGHKLLESSEPAAAHAACLVGIVTHAANNAGLVAIGHYDQGRARYHRRTRADRGRVGTCCLRRGVRRSEVMTSVGEGLGGERLSLVAERTKSKVALEQ